MNAPAEPLPAPPPESRGADRLAALLERMGAPDASPALLAEAARLLEVVRPRRGWFPTFEVRGHRVARHGERGALRADAFHCDCRAPLDPTCPHIAAALIALAWSDPEWKPRFTEPLWALALLPLMACDPREAQPAGPRPHRGWVRYHLVPPEEVGWGRDGLNIERQLIRLTARGDRELKPVRCPGSVDGLRAKISDLTPADLAFAEAWEQLAELHRLTARHGRAPTVAATRILARLRRQALEALVGAGDVRYLGAPIRASLAPWRPEIRAEEVEGGLRLRWREPVRAHWCWGAGLVLTAGGVLRPLAGGLPDALIEAIERPLPAVPAADVPEFVDRFAVGGLAVDLGEVRAGIHTPDSAEDRLSLSEEGSQLRVDARFAYRLGDEVAEVAPDDPGPLARVDSGLLRRDRVREEARLEALAEVIGAPVPLSLSGEAALDFLLDKLPSLPEGWTVYGDRALAEYRLQGALTPSVSVPSGVDWFDLEVSFEAADVRAAPRAVLTGWLEGRRYIRLKSGAFARLPETWLARHGRVLEELLDLKRGRERLGPYALPLAEQLLEEDPSLLPARWRALARRLARFEGVARADTAGVNATLRAYQRRGVDWLIFLRDHGLGGVLADDMGLGKTLQALAALADTHRASGTPPSLVVAPTSVVHNWAREAERFTPALQVVVHHGSDRDPAKLAGADVVITSYALLRLDRAALEAREWTWLILDEAQAIKNPGAQVSRAARALTARHRLALTGTPLENDLVELWSLFEFLMPGFFGARAGFVRRYALPIRRHQDPQTLAALRARVKPFLLRRLKSEVAHELPPRQEVVLYCELGEAQRRLYEQVRDTYRASVLDAGEDRSRRLHVLEALTRLRQACCHPALLPFPGAARVSASAKLDALLETLEVAISEGHRSLVFSQWPSFLKQVRARLEDRGWGHLYLDGATGERAALVDRWNDPDGPPVFLISLKAGGTGLNLTGADHVFHLDPWWNPAVEDQATDRAHRIGQTRPVVSYKLVARGTVEEKILELQARKRAVFEAAIDAERLVVSELTREDLEAVFGAHTPHHPGGDVTPPI